MTRLSLARDRRGTAAIEFGLILPVMMLLGVGLVDTVLRNLLTIDVEMAADVGARMALHPGATTYEVTDAMLGLGVSGLDPAITVFWCGTKNKNDGKEKNNIDNDKNKVKSNNGEKHKAGSDSSEVDADDSCNTLPYGEYVRIVAVARRASLFGAGRSTTITAVTHVRLP